MLLAAAWGVAFSLCAQQRSLESIEQIAAERLSVPKENLRKVVFPESGRRRIGGTLAGKSFPIHIFNNIERRSFVIVSGDVRMKEVLGSCEGAVFNVDSVPCGLSALLSHYAEQYEAVRREAPARMEEKSVDRNLPDVAPMISTRWGQGAPYNDKSPCGSPSGCVATAMAQIMNFYQYPATGVGSFSYVSATSGYRMSCNFAWTHFDWANMEEAYASSATGFSQSRAAVAHLMEACGVSVGMDYTPFGSGAYDTSVPYALIHFFNYNKNVVCYTRSHFSSDVWYDKVFAELEAGRPILYGARNADDHCGHAFIVDGCRASDGMFHVNWGWDGSYDGYYELDALEPGGSQYCGSQSMIAGFCPEDIGRSEDTFYASEFSCSGRLGAGRDAVFVLNGLENYSNACSGVVANSCFSGVIGVGLFDSDFCFARSLGEERVEDLGTYGGVSELVFSVHIPIDGISPQDTYYIMPYAQGESSAHPTPIRTLGGLTDYVAFRGDGKVGASVAAMGEETVSVGTAIAPSSVCVASPVYSLSGARLSSNGHLARPGLYIRDGRKFVVR